MNPNPAEPCQYADKEWVDLLRSRAQFSAPEEKAAVDAAINCLWEKLYIFCVNRAARYRQDEQVAQDAATCAYLRIRSAVDRGSYRQEGRFLHWCYKIAANCLYDLWRVIFERSHREVDFPEETNG